MNGGLLATWPGDEWKQHGLGMLEQVSGEYLLSSNGAVIQTKVLFQLNAIPSKYNSKCHVSINTCWRLCCMHLCTYDVYVCVCAMRVSYLACY